VQPLGDDATSVEVMHGGLVTVLSVRVNVNIKTETVEELVAKKKSMHIAAMKAMIDDLGADLKSISESKEFLELAPVVGPSKVSTARRHLAKRKKTMNLAVRLRMAAVPYTLNLGIQCPPIEVNRRWGAELHGPEQDGPTAFCSKTPVD